MSDDQRCAATTTKLVVDADLRHGIEGTRRFIEDQDCRIRGQRSCNLQALSLTTAEVASTLVHVGLVHPRTRGNDVVNVRILRCDRRTLRLDGRIPE